MEGFTPQLRIEDLPRIDHGSARYQDIAADATSLLNRVTQDYIVNRTNGAIEPDIVNQVTANHTISSTLREHFDRPVQSYYNTDLLDIGIRERYYVRTSIDDTSIRDYPLQPNEDLRTPVQGVVDTERVNTDWYTLARDIRSRVIDYRICIKCDFEVFDGYLSNDVVKIEVLIKPDEKTLAFLNKVYNFVWEDKQ